MMPHTQLVFDMSGNAVMMSKRHRVSTHGKHHRVITHGTQSNTRLHIPCRPKPHYLLRMFLDT